VAVNQRPHELNSRIAKIFGWPDVEFIEWRSPLEADEFAEYQDESFLAALGLENLTVPLREFWPARGPCWDALAVTRSGKRILVEAKAYVEEAVDFGSKASPQSLSRISASLADARKAYAASSAAPWDAPLYQYANRLAHLYYLRDLNKIDAYLLFLYFADASDVPNPSSRSEWIGAVRLIKKCLGLPVNHPFRSHVGTLIWDVRELQGGIR
jgi:hypothetical protein